MNPLGMRRTQEARKTTKATRFGMMPGQGGSLSDCPNSAIARRSALRGSRERSGKNTGADAGEMRFRTHGPA